MIVIICNYMGKNPIIQMLSIPWTSTIKCRVIIFKCLYFQLETLSITPGQCFRILNWTLYLDSCSGVSFSPSFLKICLVTKSYWICKQISNPCVMMAFVEFGELFWILSPFAHQDLELQGSIKRSHGSPCLYLRLLVKRSHAGISSNTTALECFSHAFSWYMRTHIILPFVCTGDSEAKT